MTLDDIFYMKYYVYFLPILKIQNDRVREREKSISRWLAKQAIKILVPLKREVREKKRMVSGV